MATKTTAAATTASSPTTRIDRVRAREVLDSRGNPTLRVEVRLAAGALGTATVPSGASTGAHEAIELRDGGPRFGGKGVLRAKQSAEGPLAEAVRGLDASDVATVDGAMRRADGTPNLSRLGANAVLGVSLASAKAAAAARGVPFYRFAAEAFGSTDLRMPVPMLNVLNGGAHADNGLDVQEFMVAPTGAGSFREAIRAGAEVYQALQRTLRDRGLSTGVGDEGGFAPRVASNGEALDLVAEGVRAAGWRLGADVRLALDVAATELHRDGAYAFEGGRLSAADLRAVYERWLARHPIYSIEDGLAEDDWEGWTALTAGLGGRVQLVGDDLFVTDVARLLRGVGGRVANAVLVKPNQIGTLTDTFRCVRAAYDAGYGAVMSHRSGETEDTTIADLAVGLGTGQIKTGAPCRAERTAKYNRLLEIEEELEAALGGPVPYGPRRDARA
jgi:enolase